MTNIFFILLLLFANLLLFLNHKKFAKIINIYDEPDSFRKIHKYPTPLIGGFYFLDAAKTSIHEISGILMWVISAICFTGYGIIAEIEKQK